MSKYNKVLLLLYGYALIGSLNINNTSTEESVKDWKIKRDEYEKEILELMSENKKCHES